MHSVRQLHRSDPLLDLVLQHQIDTVGKERVIEGSHFLDAVVDCTVDNAVSLGVVAFGGGGQCAEFEEDHADCEYVGFGEDWGWDVVLGGVVEDLED